MSLHRRYSPQWGYTPVISRGELGLELIEFGVLRLMEGETHTESSPDEEMVFVLLSGECIVSINGGMITSIRRRNLFSDRPSGVYLPFGSELDITPLSEVEMAVCKAPSDLESPPQVITPEDVKYRSVGAHNWRRDIYDIVDLDVQARSLVVGETFNPPGNWSSAPPHRHDFDNLPEESDMEEVYFFKLYPEEGFGLQRIYTDDLSLNEAYVIENNSVVAIPRGYHPVVAGPGYRLYYLWVLAGEKRVLAPRDDPKHAWLKRCEPIVNEILR
ncbi:TPA: 5-deoxy-glucuronate isomerase [Candidatus Poribacteria bacterium]|nr:5-deoxy-glucuronate isomerase [Candidatus Poribacteria bacterium]